MSSVPLKVWDGTQWVNIGVQGGTVLYQNEQPASPQTGMIWIDADSETSVLNDEDYLTLSTASATYAPSASPTFTGEVNLPATTNYDGNLLSDTLASKLDTSTGYAYNSTLYFTSSGTFVKADFPWLRAIKVMCVGSGGAGGAISNPVNGYQQGAMGGGGGAYAEKWITDIASLSASVTVTVAAGGVGNSGANGSGGSASSFTSGATELCGASGGAGGGASANGGTAEGASTGTGDIVFAGGAGQQTPYRESNGTPNIAYNGAGGAGGNAGGIGGGGGRPGSLGGATKNNGGTGGFPGGGGGGAGGISGSNATSGGAGGAGVVIVELYA